ncbi:MAG: hypothetical protein ACKO14_00435 [Armatimonadota bacterium]
MYRLSQRSKQLMPLVAIVVAAGVLTDNALGQDNRSRPSPSQGGRDAFMPVPSTTAADLARRLEADPKLLRAYAKHFGIDAKRITAFVKDALVLRPLPRAQAVVTYGRRPSGQVYPVRQVLPAGSMVWMTRDGKAWLKWKCTNPLGRDLPIVPMPPREGSGSEQFQLEISRPAGTLRPLTESQGAATVLSLREPGDPPFLIDSPYKPAPYSILPLGLGPIPEESSRKNISPWLWAVGATLPRGRRTTTVIPEPATLMFMVFGGAMTLTLFLLRKPRI